MGVEFTMMIGEVSNITGDGERSYLMLLASVDMDKIYGSHLESLTTPEKQKLHGKPVYLYSFPSVKDESRITEDYYGDGLMALPPAVVLNALSYDIRHGEHRRFTIAKSLLSEIVRRFPGENIGVVLFGH